jgi:biopolymer transport protein ExbB
MIMWEFLKAGGIIMVPLVITSVVALAFILERALALRWNRVIPPGIEEAVDNSLTPEDLPHLREVCEQNPSPLSRLLLVAQDHLRRPKDENADAIQTRARREILKLERGLVVLEVSVGIAPLLGLVGAIYGLITLFGGMGTDGVVDNATLAKGIAEALNTTLTGLLIAIVALVAWSYFNKKVEVLAAELETVCDKFLLQNYRGKKRF